MQNCSFFCLFLWWEEIWDNWKDFFFWKSWPNGILKITIMTSSNFCQSKTSKNHSFTFHIILIDNVIFFCEKPYSVLKCLVGNETANQTTLKRQKVFSLSPWVSCHFSFSYFLLSFTFQWTRTSVFSSSLFFLQFFHYFFPKLYIPSTTIKTHMNFEISILQHVVLANWTIRALLKISAISYPTFEVFFS